MQKAIAAGLTAVVSAGNSAGDACNQSPASLPDAITVGSSDVNDQVSGFSNKGCCVDIYAPGTNIAAAWIGGGNIVISGTSMA